MRFFISKIIWFWSHRSGTRSRSVTFLYEDPDLEHFYIIENPELHTGLCHFHIEDPDHYSDPIYQNVRGSVARSGSATFLC